jgi:AcrR family transcriptional regulator
MSTDSSTRSPTLRAQRATATREAIIDVARRLFIERGYASTLTEEIVAAAGVGTRGALYHHFDGKEELFEAVFATISADLGRQIARNVDESGMDPLAALQARFLAFLDCIVSRKDARVILRDGPAALGWQRFRAVEARHGLGRISEQLQAAMDAGIIADQPILPLSHLVLALVEEAALYVGVAKQPKRARDEAAVALCHLLDGLRFRAPGRARRPSVRNRAMAVARARKG